MPLPLVARRKALEKFGNRNAVSNQLVLSPYTRDRSQAERWLGDSGAGTDGVVAKRHDRAYESGERAMIKVKRLRTADCVVGGFRYETNSREVGSLLLGTLQRGGRTRSYRIHVDDHRCRALGADSPTGGSPRTAWLYR